MRGESQFFKTKQTNESRVSVFQNKTNQWEASLSFSKQNKPMRDKSQFFKTNRISMSRHEFQLNVSEMISGRVFRVLTFTASLCALCWKERKFFSRLSCQNHYVSLLIDFSIMIDLSPREDIGNIKWYVTWENTYFLWVFVECTNSLLHWWLELGAHRLP